MPNYRLSEESTFQALILNCMWDLPSTVGIFRLQGTLERMKGHMESKLINKEKKKVSVSPDLKQHMWGNRSRGHHGLWGRLLWRILALTRSKADPSGTPITYLAKVKFPNPVAVRTIPGSTILPTWESGAGHNSLVPRYPPVSLSRIKSKIGVHDVHMQGMILFR
jgi:hypothetical protein